MNFGSSIGDIILCGKFAYDLYHALKDGPTHCAEFAADLRHFSVMLTRVSDKREFIQTHLQPTASKELVEFVGECWKFLWISMNKAHVYDPNHDSKESDRGSSPWASYTSFKNNQKMKDLGFRFRQANFASKIEGYQSCLRRLKDRLLDFETMVTFDHISMMKEVQEAQSMTDRELCNKLDQYQQYQEHSHRSIIKVSSRLEDSQSRIERRLDALLAFDRRRWSPLVSRTLDASSPEGRDTWMMLGRQLRDEGIAPKDIKAHKDGLVLAMKNAMADLTQNANSPSSYHTALGSSFTTRQRTPIESTRMMPTLSSKPREAGFLSPSFAEDRTPDVPGAWQEQSNVDGGIASLLYGMESSDKIEIPDESDEAFPYHIPRSEASSSGSRSEISFSESSKEKNINWSRNAELSGQSAQGNPGQRQWRHETSLADSEYNHTGDGFEFSTF